MKNYLSVLFFLIASLSHGNEMNVLDFGAVTDGKTLTTKAIQDAIDQCALTGGGTVTLPAGTYLTTTVFLKDGVNLHIQKGATLLGSTDRKAFTGAVVFADHIQNAAITGLNYQRTGVQTILCQAGRKTSQHLFAQLQKHHR